MQYIFLDFKIILFLINLRVTNFRVSFAVEYIIIATICSYYAPVTMVREGEH